MEVQQYVDIEIHGPHSRLKQFPDKVEERLDHGWSRNHEAEERGTTLSDKPMYSFACTETEERPAANLAMTFREDENVLFVPNIVPKEYGDLSYEQYNSLAREFYERFVQPVASDLGLDPNISSDSEPITEYASEETIEKLKRFSVGANKSTGSSHPADRQRWLDFLVAAHEENARLNSDILTRWLTSEGGWPEDKAHDLAIEFTFGRDLLETYDEIQ